jgi:putative transport protein
LKKGERIMKFDAIGWMLNPFILMFLAVFTGMLFGKIKFGKFNFGVSGTLFTGLIIGWWAFGYADKFKENSSAVKLVKAGVIPKDFFYLFLILFVAAVGLLAAKDMGVVLKKYGAKFVILGFIITLLGAGATYGMTLISGVLDIKSTPYQISGVYTGALTSSPGLAAAMETAKGHATHRVDDFEKASVEEKRAILEDVGVDLSTIDIANYELKQEEKELFIKNAEAGISVGHAIGYPFGVLIVIIAVNFFPKIFGIKVDEEMKAHRAEMEAAKRSSGVKEIEEVSFDLTAFAVACFFGYTLGKVKIYLGPVLGDFSLGATGGVLIGSLILGYIGKIGMLHFRMNNKILGVVRQVSLAFFLAIVGLRYGYKVVEALTGSGAYLAVVSLVVGVVAMMVGFIIGKYVFKINWIMLSGAICGGMTSTPGLGAAIDAVGSDEPAAGYGATYPFALLGMVIFTIILHRLPM